MKYYGNLFNRLEEGKDLVDQIKVGDDVTMYFWSDRKCFFVTEVIDQKHIKVKEYIVLADQDSPKMSNHWKYFKTAKEAKEYFNKYNPEVKYQPSEPYEIEWVYRYGNWHSAKKWNLKKCEDKAINPRIFFQGKDLDKVLEGKDVYKYNKLEKVSFGRRDYYYDYQF